MNKFLLFILCLIIISCNSEVKRKVETCEVKKGDFFIDITEQGEIHATHAINISTPSMSWEFGLLKIIKIVEDGSEVNKGDTVILIDPSEVQKAIIDAEAELEIAKAELEKMKAEQESKIEELEADLKVSELSHQITEIKLEQATFEADITRKEIRLNLDQAKIALEKAREEIINQKKIHFEELQQSKIKIEQLVANLENAHITLKNLTVVSPDAGIAIIRKNWWTKNKWQVGDQPWSGAPIIDLPDLSELKVVAEINEVDISKIKIGQKVEIRIDAFSDTVYTASVISIAGLAEFKNKDSKIKIFPVEILIDSTSEKFLPGMTVSCKILVNKFDDVLYIPLEALSKTKDRTFVYVKSGNTYKKKNVKVGNANNDYVVIDDGLKQKDIIALMDPFAESENIKE